MSRALTIVLAAALGLAGSLLVTLFLFHAAQGALDKVLEERLRGAGESAALLLGATPASSEQLRALMRANALDGAYLLDRSLTLLADAGGRTGRADLLRVDPERIERAFAGQASVAKGYSLGELAISTGYFPVRSRDGVVTAVLAFEAGQAFADARRDLVRARAAALLLSLIGALALAILAARWSALERVRRREAEQAARGESIARMGDMVAHEIRNPIGVIRAAVELMRERAAPLPDWQREQLADVLSEVERMRRLTEDFLSLGTPDRPLVRAAVDLGSLLEDSVRAAETTFREVRIRCEVSSLPPIAGDAHRLRQVFANLLANAAQAQQPGEVEVRAEALDGFARVRIHDGGPGIPAAVRERLFDPFLTTKPGGTGLGLAVARMLVERHGGTLGLVDDGRPGATFEVRLPAEREARAWPASS
jgi:signal transduction histidine kinase